MEEPQNIANKEVQGEGLQEKPAVKQAPIEAPSQATPSQSFNEQPKQETPVSKPVHVSETRDPFKDSPSFQPYGESSGSSGMWKDIGTWKFVTGIVALLLVVSIFTGGFNFGGNGVTAAVVGLPLSEDQAVDKTLEFINNNILQGGLSASVQGSSDVGDLYKVDLLVAGQLFESYITKDGRLLFPQGFDTAEIQAQPEAPEQPSVQRVPVVEGVSAEGQPFKGDEDAPITIIEFSDFQCPFCARFYTDTMPQIMENYVETGKAKLVYRDFPLENIHPEATPSAEAAECAREQGKFWEMHDLLFENQRTLSDANYKKWAAELGLDTAKFNDCVDTNKYADEVQLDLTEGGVAGVTGTPAFFINGRLISGAQPFSVFESIIEAELEPDNFVDAKESDDSMMEKHDSGDVMEEKGTDEVVVASQTEEVKITAKKFRFVPDEITVQEGSTIELAVESQDIDWGFVLKDFGVELDLVSGETATAEFVANKKGTFTFMCSDCDGREGIMQGRLVVE